MFLGRILGWVLLAVSLVMASADAVMALGPADYSGILTSDVLTLLTGGAPDMAERNQSFLLNAQRILLDLPAWIAMAVMGSGLLVACRPRVKRYRFRRS